MSHPGVTRTGQAGGVFDRHDDLAFANHEQVVFCRDTESGLRAIISIHDTSLGPALGGTRFYPYKDEAAALTDGLRLSQGMTFKAAAAGLPLGGGKAVIIGDPGRLKTPQLLRAYGRFVETLGGRYTTAADVGTTSDDLDVIAESTGFVVGKNLAWGGSGDSGYSTALGVFVSMVAAARLVWGVEGLSARTVGVEGAGKVGSHLVDLLVAAGARVTVSDRDPGAVGRIMARHPGIVSASEVLAADVDVYAPCALGGTLTEGSVRGVRARLICGAANNQLLTSSVGDSLATRGVVWVPDFVANAGGLIQVGGEALGSSPDEVRAGIERIGTTVTDLLAESARSNVTPAVAAHALATARIRAARDRG